jgi:hypothetical protein
MFEMKDVLQEVCNEFPEINEKAIETICKDGLMGILKLARIKEELYIRTEGRQGVKFFVPLTPDAQADLINNNRMRRFNAAKQKQNGKTSK